MRKLDTLFALIALSISTTILFQNCGSPKSNDRSSSFQIQGQDVNPEADYDFLVPPKEDPEPTVTPEPDPDPEPIMNRDYSTLLDNKMTTGAVDYSTGIGDIFIYETTYLGQTQSTEVKIQDSSFGSVLLVDSDQCTGQKNLSVADIKTFFGIFTDSYPSANVRELIASETQEMDCAFPRLIMASANTNKTDLEIYFSTRECTPEGDLYLADIAQDGNDVIIRTALQNFFQAQIDDVCGL